MVSSPSNIAMAIVQTQRLSERFPTERLCRHWSQNKSGFCLLPSTHLNVVEDIPHILQICDALQDTRNYLLNFTKKYCENVPSPLLDLIMSLTDPSSLTFCQFLLDCSSIPSIIRVTQDYDRATVFHHTFKITRTWVYSLHKRRMQLLGRWNILTS